MLLRSFQGHSHNVSSVIALPLLQNLIVSVSEDASMRIWNSTEGKEVYAMKLGGELRGWMVATKDHLCAVAHDNGVIILNIHENMLSQSV